MSGAKTTAERQAALKARREKAGFKRVANLWAHPEDHEPIKQHAAKLARKRQQKQP